MMTKHVVVNLNYSGNLVAQIVEVSESGSPDDRMMRAVRKRASQIGGIERIVAVSGSIPSMYGRGGSYLFSVTPKPPAPIEPEVVLRQMKTIADFWDREPKY